MSEDLPSGWKLEDEPKTLPSGWSLIDEPVIGQMNSKLSGVLESAGGSHSSNSTPLPIQQKGIPPTFTNIPATQQKAESVMITPEPVAKSTRVTPLYFEPKTSIPSSTFVGDVGIQTQPKDTPEAAGKLDPRLTNLIQSVQAHSVDNSKSKASAGPVPSVYSNLPEGWKPDIDETPKEVVSISRVTPLYIPHKEVRAANLYTFIGGVSIQNQPEMVKADIPTDIKKSIPRASTALESSDHAVEIHTSKINLPTKVSDEDRSSLLNYSQHTVTVSIPDKKVIVQDPSGKVIRTYSAFLGKSGSPTPEGQFRILGDMSPSTKGPEWYYGGHFMPFKVDEPNKSIFGFHGWSYDKDDDEIERSEPGWKTSTHGCVQLSNPDVADFSRLVSKGDTVKIINRMFKP